MLDLMGSIMVILPFLMLGREYRQRLRCSFSKQVTHRRTHRGRKARRRGAANHPCARIAWLGPRQDVTLGPDVPLEAGVAQLVEQLIRNQQVSGSSPLAGSSSPL